MKRKCNTCYGYGFWSIGDAVPIGQIDGEDGVPSTKCPECGAGGNV